jgi:glycosyltransferase involved in cell wall biosynthesis
VAEIIKKDITENAHINLSKVVTIHSSILIERFNEEVNASQIRKELNISSDTPLVGMIGRIRDHKDYPNFLGACKIVKERMPSVKFIIVGEGPKEKEVKNLAKELDIQDIFFLGKREDIPEILASLDVFVLSSSVEGSPAVIKEAMVMSKPVVSTSVGGIPEIIEDGVNGILVSPHSHIYIAQKILQVLQDKPLSEKLGRNAQKTILENFTPSVLAYKTKDVYLEVVSLL